VTFVRPALTVMDAVVGMDGDGPSAGEPFPVGAIVAGPDPVGVDVAALSLLDKDPSSVPTIAEAMRRGWTTGRVADLTVLGGDLAAMRVKGFRMPVGGRSAVDWIPGFLLRWGTRQLVASPCVTERCIGCRLCIQSCPAQTITQVDARAHIELADCIRCYCCHELCPEQAIELRQPWVGRMLAHIAR
jgi:ferredoxin